MKPKCSHPVLDALKDGVAIRSDADIAKRLGLDRSYISAIRSGSIPFGDSVRVKIMRQFGLSIWDIDDMEAGVL